MKGFGGMLSFELNGTYENALAAMRKLKGKFMNLIFSNFIKYSIIISLFFFIFFNFFNWSM